jgi:hypothetical protein
VRPKHLKLGGTTSGMMDSGGGVTVMVGHVWHHSGSSVTQARLQCLGEAVVVGGAQRLEV